MRSISNPKTPRGFIESIRLRKINYWPRPVGESDDVTINHTVVPLRAELQVYVNDPIHSLNSLFNDYATDGTVDLKWDEYPTAEPDKNPRGR